MAYADLANTDYSVGLYTAIFPVFIYLFFGPSRHISFGTNPLTSIIVGECKYVAVDDVNRFLKNSTQGLFNDCFTGALVTTNMPGNGEEAYDSQTIVSTVALLAGLFQFLCAILKVGKFSWILSDILVSGYTTAAAIHVAVSQLRSLFGLDLGSHSGALTIPYVSKSKGGIKQPNKIYCRP